jgi:type I restriction enzyme R subunit
MGQKKSQGNVVCFRNLKEATDQAIELFANKDAKEEIILAPYEDYVKRFNEAAQKLFAITPTVSSVDSLESEEDEAQFVQAFRDVIRIKNILNCFTGFSFNGLAMTEQMFADYRSKYLDLYDKVRSDRAKEKVSILNDIDFEIELISRDKINVSYIIKLLRNMQKAKPAERQKRQNAILNIVESEPQLRSKKELIEEFIKNIAPAAAGGGDVAEEFDEFWVQKKKVALETLSSDEKLEPAGLEKVIGDYLFTEKPPMRDDVIRIMKDRPGLRERGSVAQRIIDKIKSFVETFVDGID